LAFLEAGSEPFGTLVVELVAKSEADLLLFSI